MGFFKAKTSIDDFSINVINQLLSASEIPPYQFDPERVLNERIYHEIKVTFPLFEMKLLYAVIWILVTNKSIPLEIGGRVNAFILTLGFQFLKKVGYSKEQYENFMTGIDDTIESAAAAAFEKGGEEIPYQDIEKEVYLAICSKYVTDILEKSEGLNGKEIQDLKNEMIARKSYAIMSFLIKYIEVVKNGFLSNYKETKFKL